MLAVVLLSLLQAEAPTRYEFTAAHMGAQWKITLYALTADGAKAAAKAAFARVAELEAVMTDYDPKSELMRACKANDAAPGVPIKLSDDLFDALRKAREITDATAGAFDPSLGPLVQLWRTTRRTVKLPEDIALSTAKALAGPTLWAVDAKAHTLTLCKAKMRLDLGGIGKGYAADAALAVLKEHGIRSALIAASGDITAGDAPPGRTGWAIDIAPLRKGDAPRKLCLANHSVSTSGDLYQHIDIAGVRYSHVLNPATGLGQTGWRSATVVMPSGWRADACTKALLLLPEADAAKLIDQFGGQFFLAVQAKPGNVPTELQSKGFEKFQAK